MPGIGTFTARLVAGLVIVVLGAGCATRPRPVPRETATQALARRNAELERARARRAQLSDRSRSLAPDGDDRPVAVAPVDGLALAPLQRAAYHERPGAPPPRFSWPVDGPVSSQYGRRGRRHHDGIDISAPVGTPVRAAADGVVVYVGSLRGYGRMIILRHVRGYFTAYAHNARHYVAHGDQVRRGEVIATVGRTGRTTGPNLHFEVRRNAVAYNPLSFLPPRSQAVARGG